MSSSTGTSPRHVARWRSDTPIWRLIAGFAMLWERPSYAAIMALLVYTSLAAYHQSPVRVSNHPYFNYLADAVLHGQLFLRQVPPNVHDLVQFNGKYYLYWPPLPAVLLMPFVALFGVGFYDITFTLVFGALNVFVVARMLRLACIRRIISLSRVQRGLLVLTLAL